MMNKRLSAIALSMLMSFASVTSSAYAAPVYAAETVGTETVITVDEETSDESNAAFSDAAHSAETLQCEDDEMSGVQNPKQEDAAGTNDPTDQVPSVASGEGDEIVDPGTGTGGGEPVDPGSGTEGGEPVDPGSGTGSGGTGENENRCEINGHSWNDGVVEAEADCTNEGRIVFTCAECGETRYETIAAKGHVFGEWAVVTPATTRVDGKSEHTCTECGVTESKVIPHTILKVKSIKLSKTAAAVFKWKAVQLKATVAPADATSTAVTWKSSNTKVATVTSAGKVTAKGKGTATIICTAKDGSGVKATCRITVKILINKVSINRSTAKLVKGKSLTLKATVAPTAASNKTVAWKSSNTKVAKVSSTGKVTAVGKGTATITCAARDGSGKKAYCKITVTAPSSSGSSYSGSSSGSGSGTVWVSATGTKYHNKNNCGTMNPSKARQMSLSEAKSKGYQPCKNCYH